MMSFRLIQTFCICLLTVTIMSGVNASVTASIDRHEIALGESVNLTITTDEATRSNPDFDMLSAVFEVGETGRSMSTKIINGAVSSETRWTVTLVPKSLGSHIIPPITVGNDQTQAIKITVKKPDPNATTGGNLFIEWSTNKDQAFVQEEIILTVKLFYAVGLNNASLTDPKADGLIVYPINKAIQYTTRRNGTDYQVLERKYALFAEQSGELNIPPIVFQGEVMDGQSRNQIGLFRQGRPVRISSAMLTLDIKQIPADFVHKDWLPATTLMLDQSWPQNQVYRVGEPITRRLDITAQGLAETQLPDIAVTDIDGARIYQEKSDTITRNNGNHLVSSKSITQAVIPNQAGPLQIPGIDIEWYNTETGEAQTTRLPAITLDIKPAAGGQQQQSPPQAANFDAQQPAPTQVAIAEDQAEDITATNPLWFYGTVIFGLLWLFTLVLFMLKLKSSGSKQIPSRPQPPSSQISLKNINQMSPGDCQNQLIKWWNQQYQQQVTHLGEIQQQLDDATAIAAIAQLQKQLYVDSTLTAETDWQRLIKKGHFKPKLNTNNGHNSLPGLYD
ncbi:MAG: protein BatD [Proteobacteria bacterium]|nr:MAG: protein BatD [Pseudomonadota bacterium]